MQKSGEGEAFNTLEGTTPPAILLHFLWQELEDAQYSDLGPIWMASASLNVFGPEVDKFFLKPSKFIEELDCLKNSTLSFCKCAAFAQILKGKQCDVLLCPHLLGKMVLNLYSLATNSTTTCRDLDIS